jgi:hypothetical protein
VNVCEQQPDSYEASKRTERTPKSGQDDLSTCNKLHGSGSALTFITLPAAQTAICRSPGSLK